MLGKFVVLAMVAFVFHEAQPLKAPSYFKKCATKSPNFNECAKASAQEAIKTIVKGDRKYKIPELNPLILPLINMDQGKNLKIKLMNTEIHKLPAINVEKCDFDFQQKKISLTFFAKELVMNGKYEMDGRILVLPIQGKGNSHLELKNLRFTYNLNFDKIQKDGVSYLKPYKGEMSYNMEGMKLRFDNLFNGDKLLGEETNNFLNENWKEVSNELGPGLIQGISEIIHLLLSNVCELIPYDELFPETL